MALRKFKCFFTFLLLLEVVSLIFLPFFETSEVYASNSFINYRKKQTKRNISAVFTIKAHGCPLQNHRDRFQSIFKEASSALTSGFLTLDSDYHQYNLSAERLTKLMLFPYHSFW
ncbi:hypothetical protein [Mucilaginibacter glaciei]|uniref:Uncharacterized protein n=1 Tax=Mucilaginibacter glaciei TaxID=2772109 RepID=A0A926S2X9_9SPHI|nr:hypothetical protein [Mucilaginibacter glaciei]MBD1393639.1 hypothetical protein [Mucilaginibacter glaciei]